jgi:site-specific recombinase XerD
MTTNELAILTKQNELTESLSEDRARYAQNVLDTMASETQRAYRSRLSAFSAWCSDNGRSALPASPSTVAAYLAALESSGHKAATIAQVVAAIAKAHRVAGYENPCASDEVKTARRAANRRIGVAPHQKAAATLPVLHTIIQGIEGTTLKDKRDKALLLVGFAGAFRRSELAALRVSDLREDRAADGRAVVVVTVRRSKTDQTGQGMEKAIFSAAGREKKLCPVRALREWIAAAGLTGDDALFPSIRKGGKPSGAALSGHHVAKIIQDRGRAAGVELELSGHSLRRGFVTEAVAAGATERAIMHQTGHKSATTVRLYMERHDAIADNAAAII